jgi:hypothetical protein
MGVAGLISTLPADGKRSGKMPRDRRPAIDPPNYRDFTKMNPL